MYEYILKHIQATRPTAAADTGAYLRKLKAKVQDFRARYGGQGVLDYADAESRAAYLLTYYPHHVRMARHAISCIPAEWMAWVSARTPMRAIAVGGGPGPEVAALCFKASHAVQNNTRPQVQATILDSAAQAWREDSEVSVGIGSQYADLTLELVQFDLLRDPLPLATGVDVILFQNVINEVVTVDAARALIVVQQAYASLNRGGVLVVADRYGSGEAQDPNGRYTACRQFVHDIPRGVGVPAIRAYDDPPRHLETTLNILPELIRTNLLTGESGLIPAKNIYVSCSVFGKG